MAIWQPTQLLWPTHWVLMCPMVALSTGKRKVSYVSYVCQDYFHVNNLIMYSVSFTINYTSCDQRIAEGLHNQHFYSSNVENIMKSFILLENGLNYCQYLQEEHLFLPSTLPQRWILCFSVAFPVFFSSFQQFM